MALACAALAVASVTAVASTPSSGKVSKAAPKTQWSGSNISGAVAFNAINQNDTTPCEAPSCDSYSLEVVDPGGELSIKVGLALEASEGDATALVRVTDPAGKALVSSGPSSAAKPFKVTVKNAAAGVYTVDVTDSFVCCGPSEYAASAELSFGAPAGTPEAPAAPAAPNAAPAPSFSVKAATVSAKKVNKAKKLAATLTSSAKLSQVRVILVQGKKQFGAGTLASLDGTAKATVKLKRKLKKGTYAFAASGIDGQGRKVVAGVKFKVKK